MCHACRTTPALAQLEGRLVAVSNQGIPCNFRCAAEETIRLCFCETQILAESAHYIIYVLHAHNYDRASCRLNVFLNVRRQDVCAKRALDFVLNHTSLPHPLLNLQHDPLPDWQNSPPGPL